MLYAAPLPVCPVQRFQGIVLQTCALDWTGVWNSSFYFSVLGAAEHAIHVSIHGGASLAPEVAMRRWKQNISLSVLTVIEGIRSQVCQRREVVDNFALNALGG
eukprot:1361511-Prymnesium_polylepis.1